jgi:hypothetical protein
MKEYLKTIIQIIKEKEKEIDQTKDEEKSDQ